MYYDKLMDSWNTGKSHYIKDKKYFHYDGGQTLEQVLMGAVKPSTLEIIKMWLEKDLSNLT